MKIRSSVLFCLVIFCFVCANSYAGDAEKDALKTAENWLILIDANDYGMSWEKASQLFKKSITKEKWEQSIKAVRPALGDLISRSVKSATYATSPWSTRWWNMLSFNSPQCSQIKSRQLKQ